MTPFRKRHLLAAIVAVSLATAVAAHGVDAAQPADAPVPGADAWTIPIAPPQCTEAQADTGDVGDCLLAFYGNPARKGFGIAPAPGVGEGWNWTGSTYSDSPALAEFEAQYITSNSEPVAGTSVGSLQTHRAVQSLVEGFLNEISEGGYEVRHISAYSFRCTSGNGGWSCPSGDPDDLSRHAWGIAFDMNSGQNPIVTYRSQDGQSACITPIQTDFPRWAIQVAEKWGLYWGGYGWNSGCNVAGAERTSVTRDPTHFEFRGTPEQARIIAEFNGVHPPEPICRTIVDPSGADDEACNDSGLPEAFWRLPVDLDAPVGATAAIINLTATDGAGPGYLTLETCDAREPGPRETSAITFAATESVATMAIVPLDADARFCVYRSTDVHSIVDVVAFLSADASELGDPMWFAPVTPTRLLDTREADPIGARAERRVPAPVVPTAPIPAESNNYLFANVAAIDEAGPGYLQAGACGQLGPTAKFSNLNYMGAEVRANLTLMAESDDGSCVFSLAEADVIVDQLGYLSPDEGLSWNVEAPRRALDTRECTDTWCDDRPAAGRLIRVDLNTDAPAAAIAITVTDTTGPGYASVGRCDEFVPDAPPQTSNANHSTGQTVTNLALVALDEGEMCIFTRASAHLIIDVQATLTESHETGIVPVPPTRAHDSREAVPTER